MRNPNKSLDNCITHKCYDYKGLASKESQTNTSLDIFFKTLVTCLIDSYHFPEKGEEAIFIDSIPKNVRERCPISQTILFGNTTGLNYDNLDEVYSYARNTYELLKTGLRDYYELEGFVFYPLSAIDDKNPHISFFRLELPLEPFKKCLQSDIINYKQRLQYSLRAITNEGENYNITVSEEAFAPLVLSLFGVSGELPTGLQVKYSQINKQTFGKELYSFNIASSALKMLSDHLEINLPTQAQGKRELTI